MAKQIIFSYEGKDYTLEYTRRTIPVSYTHLTLPTT